MTILTRRPWTGFVLLVGLAVILTTTLISKTAAESVCTAENEKYGSCISSDAAAGSPEEKVKNSKKTETPLKQPECTVYMAPSTIGTANMGIYTAIPLQKGDVVNFPEIVIPLLFREWSEEEGHPDGSLWERYIWEGYVTSNEPKDDLWRNESAGAVFVPGVGCTINGRLDLHNILSTHGSKYDQTGLHRSKDPGVGAFTPYHDSRTVASVYMKAGAELFADYGSDWIPDIPGVIVTFDENLDDADEFVEEFDEWVQQQGDTLSDKLKDALWNFTAQDFYPDSQILRALPRAPWSDVRQALSRAEEASNEKEKVEEDPYVESPVRHFISETGHQSVEWLQEHGRCQDHIKPGISKIPQAGRGAFASRDLPKGTIVGHAPLVHNARNRDLYMITYENDDPQEVYKQEDLVINYSFGHRDSTLLLTPYGAMVNYINHDRYKPNVRIQWPKEEMIAHKPDWLERDIDFLSLTHEKIGLAFDYVALRDIQEGEEILMDYGHEWGVAWKEHVSSWKPPPNAKDYVHATEWKKRYLRTEDELEHNPYPDNLITLCMWSYSENHETGEQEWTPVLDETDERLYCDVLERTVLSDDSPLYTVRLHFDDDSEVVVKNVPEEGVQLVDRSWSADWHLEGAFRHEIMIPDDMFPYQWKNGRDDYIN